MTGGWPVFLSNALTIVAIAGCAYLAGTGINRWVFRHVRRCDNPLHRVEAPAYAAVLQTEMALGCLLMAGAGIGMSAMYAWVWDAWPVTVGWVVLVVLVERRVVRQWGDRRRAELREAQA